MKEPSVRSPEETEWETCPPSPSSTTASFASAGLR